jgi:hypothetical protein
MSSRLTGQEILLENVMISDGLIQYDFEREYDDRFIRKKIQFWIIQGSELGNQIFHGKAEKPIKPQNSPRCDV